MNKQYQTCRRCNGFRCCWWDSKNGTDVKCRACDGLGVVPVNNEWRPYEPRRDGQ